MNQKLLDFEKLLGIGPTFTARLLGLAYPTYAAYRSGSRELPIYIDRSICAHTNWRQAVRGDVQGESNFQEYTNGKSRRS